MRVLSVEPTPNPNAFKFIVDGKVVPSGVRNFTKAAEAHGDPLAHSLFGIDGVDTVFFCDNFVTVSMLPSADWRGVHDAVVQTLNGFTGEPLAAASALHEAPTPAVADAAGIDDPELMDKINDLLDDRVRPALAGDGGGLQILSLNGKVLRIRYQGACGSCPSSAAGTLYAIQNLIQSEIDSEVEVVSA